LRGGESLGTPPQLLGAMFNQVGGLGMTYVPYILRSEAAKQSLPS
jgi:tripartite-type tricarboxylate transporter receptor subunit TctC